MPKPKKKPAARKPIAKAKVKTTKSSAPRLAKTRAKPKVAKRAQPKAKPPPLT